MVDSVKAADVKIIPYKHTFDGVIEVLTRQRRYVEPPYHCPEVQSNVDEGPASDSNDHTVKANVVGDDRKRALETHTKPEVGELPVRKKTRLREKDSTCDLLTHEGLIRVGSAWLARIEAFTNLQNQAGRLVSQKLEEGLPERQQIVQLIR